MQDSELICVADTPSECSQQLLRTMINDDCELITLYYGTDISAEEANTLSLDIKSEFSNLEIETYSGGQPLYHYIISVE